MSVLGPQAAVDHLGVGARNPGAVLWFPDVKT